MIMLLGLFSLWKSRMTVRHAERHPKTARIFFIDLIAQIGSVYERNECPPEWITEFNSLTQIKEF